MSDIDGEPNRVPYLWYATAQQDIFDWKTRALRAEERAQELEAAAWGLYDAASAILDGDDYIDRTTLENARDELGELLPAQRPT